MNTHDAARTAHIDVASLRELMTAAGPPPRLIDVRTSGEFEAVHIPGSRNVPLDLLREHRDELRGHLGAGAVLLCRTGARARQAEQALAAAGLANLRVLDGGIVAWQAAQAPVRAGRPRWALERQVRLVAGSVVLASVLVGVAVPPVTWLAAVIGAGLTIAALTDTCLMGMLLARLPYNRGPRADLESVLTALAGDRA